MNVQELITALSEIEDKSKPVIMDIIDTEVMEALEFDAKVILFDA